MKILKKKTLKSTNAITLIALVITIIVLLILAGISISMLSGDNSILQKATDAKTNTERATIIEQARTDILGQIAENKGENITKQQLKDILNTYFDEDEVEALDIPEDTSTSTDVLTSKERNYKIRLSEIYSGTFKSLESNRIGIRILDDGSLYFTNLYEKSDENQLITQLIATEEFNDCSSDGESLPTIEEFRNLIESEAVGNITFEEILNGYLISWDVIPVVITQSVNGESKTISNYFMCVDFFEDGVYTITIADNNGKYGENTFTYTTPTLPGGSLVCCFDPGSQVLMSDGTTKAIEDVNIGDMVMSLNEDTGEYIAQKVKNCITKHNSDDLVYVNLSNGTRIGMRAYHPLLTTNGWKSLRQNLAETTIEAGEVVGLLEVGDTLVGYSENVTVVSIEQRPDIENYDTYNLSIEGYHNYIVNGVVVHNPAGPSC